jgi:hypothetical protein
MATDVASTPRDDAVLASLNSLSRVLGKEGEYQQFISYVDRVGKEQMPSSSDIAIHTPVWVRLVMPILGRLYDQAYYEGQKVADDAYRQAFSKDKVW